MKFSQLLTVTALASACMMGATAVQAKTATTGITAKQAAQIAAKK